MFLTLLNIKCLSVYIVSCYLLECSEIKISIIAKNSASLNPQLLPLNIGLHLHHHIVYTYLINIGQGK